MYLQIFTQILSESTQWNVFFCLYVFHISFFQV